MSTPDENNPVTLPVHFTGNPGRGKAHMAVPSQIGPDSPLDEILVFARHQNASDVHIGAQKPIIFRKFGQLKNMTDQILNADQISRLIAAALPQDFLYHFEQTGDAEYVHTINGYGRFRMAIMKQRNGWDLTARVIPMNIPKFEDTGMPAACAGLTKWSQGMVLVSGPAGCGKTTTLAVLVEMINQNRHDHIVTIEEPIEIVYEPKQCQITQREIKTHTLSQGNALRAALREDPDILVISELRDLSTIQLAVSAAETGHLVFGTMNTVNAVQTISSVIDSFPAEEQSIVRNMVSESLRGVICQQLVPKKDGTGMVPAYEILLITPPIANLIRVNKMTQINNAITTNRASGMVLMDNYLAELARKEIISKETAGERAGNPATVTQLLSNRAVSKIKFIEAASNREIVLNELIKYGILEESSPTEVRIKQNADVSPDVIRMIARDDFDKIWALLQFLAQRQ
ncbi:MAG: PilT/PilU family type 4a pilus ATPase [Candidatus Omnitrophica bacterium]|nr:PilT/PilU family type 4a pilus ATPase [Candidatus Omnitrophota bacterium]MDE2010510.1 PilT/PilU family type 4a pilus ATPase [Candidatus Omnitrophota bacterium]MDE2214767.1 PilT/PilU family type 4a pilus ATPase [Candidatus Omnitrophota bacterium]MDE2231450.1 PilT/PilU family type 4a pilus ATPase [Candidatus Omnitrophota bacterium]